MKTSDKKNFSIKGIGINRSHCASLCLVDDSGSPIFCVSEERFTRVKLQRGMPHKSYEYAASNYELDTAPIAVGRLDTRRRIAREVEYYKNCTENGLFVVPPLERISELARMWYRKKVLRDRAFHRLSIDTTYFMGRQADYGFEHHLCHMASAYYCAGLDEAVVISVDGVGDLLSAVVGHGSGANLEITAQYYQSQHIAGQSYEVVTGMLGFDPDRHPGKVTGLAAYCVAPDELVSQIDKWFKEQYSKGSKENWFYLIHTDKAEENLQRLRELRHSKFGQWTKEEIASAIQFILERDVLSLIKRHVTDPENKNVVLAGGVFANVKLNQRVKSLGFRNIFIQPAMGDEGTGFGAAILAAHERKPFLPYRLHDVYLGPEFTPNQMRQAIERAGLQFEELEGGKLEQRVSQLLDDGSIIARFQGRMEFGPRALGNRSILYHTKDPAANDWLNKQLKRSEFMPFAPVTLHENASECYHDVAGAEHAAEFMTITFDATPRMRRESPACVHVDGTARPQLVRREVNRSMYDILKGYHQLSGIPSLINTSFNMHEEPIICTPEEAVRAFLAANLDALAMGDFLVINQAPEAVRRRTEVMQRNAR